MLKYMGKFGIFCVISNYMGKLGMFCFMCNYMGKFGIFVLFHEKHQSH